MNDNSLSHPNPTEELAVSNCKHQEAIDRLRTRLNASLLGKEDVVEMVLVCLLARGHLLFDDLPGLG